MHILKVICLWWWWFVFLDHKGNKKGKFLIKIIAEAYVQPDPRCSDIRVEHTCWIFKQCFWNRGQCGLVFGTEAPATNSGGTNSGGTNWKKIGGGSRDPRGSRGSRITKTTEPPDCRAMKDEYTCAYSDNCFWKHNDYKCFPRHAECFELDSPTFCSFNHLCFWNKFDNSCHSVAGGCDMLYNEQACGQSTLCKWDRHDKNCIYSCKNDNARRDARAFSCADRYDHHTNECGDFDAPHNGFFAQRECCRCRDERCDCSGSHSPVCGSDGKTYSNPCSARCNGVQIVQAGTCRDFPSSDPQNQPTNFPQQQPTQTNSPNSPFEKINNFINALILPSPRPTTTITTSFKPTPIPTPHPTPASQSDLYYSTSSNNYFTGYGYGYNYANNLPQHFMAIECEYFTALSDCNHATFGNTQCIWKNNECEEIVLDCEDIDDEKRCNEIIINNRRCYWQPNCDERKCMDFIDQCEQERLAPSAGENFSTCSEFKNKYDCNGSQKGLLECYWLGAHCYDYVLDCEDLQTAKLCKGAKTQDVICLWNGSECDDGAYNPSMFSNNINNNYGYPGAGDWNRNVEISYYHSGSLSKSKKNVTPHLIKNKINQIREKEKQKTITNQIQKFQPKYNMINNNPPMYISPDSSSSYIEDPYVGNHLPQENAKFQIENQIKFFRTPFDELDHPQMSNTTHVIIELTFFTSFLIFILLLIWIFKPPVFHPEVSVSNSLSNSISQTHLLFKRNFPVVEEKKADESRT